MKMIICSDMDSLRNSFHRFENREQRSWTFLIAPKIWSVGTQRMHLAHDGGWKIIYNTAKSKIPKYFITFLMQF